MTIVVSSGGRLARRMRFVPIPAIMSRTGKFSPVVCLYSLPMGSIYDVVYKMEVGKFYKYLSAYPVYLYHCNRVFRYLYLRVNPLVDVKGSQPRAGRLEAAYQSVSTFTHRAGRSKQPALFRVCRSSTYTALHSRR